MRLGTLIAFRQMQTVKLDKLIKLFDSPGIVMSKETDPAGLVLRNCVRVSEIQLIMREHTPTLCLQIETIENPIPAVELLLNRCSKEQVNISLGLSNIPYG